MANEIPLFGKVKLYCPRRIAASPAELDESVGSLTVGRCFFGTNVLQLEEEPGDDP